MLNQTQYWKRYGVAIASVVIALFLMLALDPVLQLRQAPFLLFFGAVTVSAFYGGRNPGIVATLLSAGFAHYFFLEPQHGWNLTLASGLKLVVFILEGVLITSLVSALHAAQAQLRKNFNQLEASEAEIKDLTKELQRRVDELQTLFEVIPVNIAIAEDPDCHVVKVNTAYATLLQIPTDLNVAVTPPARQSQLPYKFYQNGRQLLGHELPVEYAAKHGVEVRDVEIELVRQDNAVFSLYGHAVPLFDESGQPRGSVGVYTNITDRKQAEIALRESEERLRIANERFELAAKAVNCLIYDWELESDRIERTDGLTKLLGYSLAEAEPTGKWWAERVHPDDLQSMRTHAWSVLAKEDNFSSEYRVLNKSNQYIYVQDQCIVVARDTDGKPTRIVGSTIDISERKQAESKLQESQRFIQQIADSMPGTLYVYDMEQQRNVYVNRQIGELLGYSPEQIQALGDQLFAQLVHPEDFAAIGLQFERLHQAQEGEPIDYEYRMRHANGEWRWLWSRNTVSTRTSDGRAYQVVGTVHDITARKQAEAELQQREQQFRTVVENTPDIIARYDRELRHLYINPSIERTLGIPPEQFIGKTAIDLGFTDERSQIWNATVQQVFDTGESHSLEYEFPNSQGELRLYQARFVPELVEASQIKTVLAVATDVTEYKRAETSLRQSEERLRLAMEAAQLGAWDLDLTTKKVIWSEQHFKMFGYEPVANGEASFEMWNSRLHPDDRKRVIQQWKQAKLKHQLYRTEYRAIRADNGQIAWLAALGSFTYNQSGQAVRSLGVVFDITNRKQAEEAILRLNQQLQEKVTELQTLLDVIPIGIGIAKDPKCHHIQVNPAFAQLLNIPPTANASLSAPTEERPTTFKVFQNQRELSPEELPLQYAAKHGVAVNDLEVDVVWQDGTVVTLLEYAAPLFDKFGQPRGSIGVFLDITERKKAETEREQLLQREQAAREQAERANRIKDEFLAVLSHELRSPLNPILGWTKLLQTRQFDTAKTAEALATIERNAKLQTQLIDDLLDIAKILRGKLTLEMATVDLVLVIEAATDTVRTAAVAKNIFLHSVLPQIGQVLGDATRLQQIVWNLLSNAVKFTPKNGRLEIRLERIGDQAQITVSDNGKGIKPDFLPYIFESFRQEDASTTRRFGGLGLGLAIVRQLVEAHGGTITATSPGEGLGATFTVQLPLVNVELEPQQTEAVSDQEPDLTGMRILIVDDEPDARELITVILTQYGAEVMTVTSAAEVLHNLEAFQPNVLVSDIGMPNVDGYSLIQKIRALPPEKGGQIPAIALTAYARGEDRQQAIASGYQCHITKPVDPEQLVRAVMHSQVFNRREQGTGNREQ